MKHPVRDSERADDLVRGHRDGRANEPSTAGSDSIASMHRAVGNRAVHRLHDRDNLQGVAVGHPNDAAERDAARVAARVMRMPADDADSSSRDGPHRSSGREIADSSGGIERGLASGGRPLPPATRKVFEPRFGRRFADVRVHTGPTADEMATSIHADAFTYGTDIVFREGKYAPDTERGQRLLAHELAHVVQQDEGPGGGRIQRQSASETTSSDDGADTAEGRMGTGPFGLTGRERVELFNEVLASTDHALAVVLFVLEHLGYQVNMGAIGVRYSAHAAPPEGGPAAGAGVEGLFVFDPAEMEVEFDIVPFAEIGAGFGGGAGIDLLLGFQLGTPAEAGGEKEMGGASFAAELNAVVGAGVWISESLNGGDEGWIVFNAGLGTELSAKATAMASGSGGRAIDALAQRLGLELLAEVNVLGEQLPIAEVGTDRTEFEPYRPDDEPSRGRVSDVFALGLLGGSQALTSPWRPADWTLRGDWTREEAAIVKSFGGMMRTVAMRRIRELESTGAENPFRRFWREEHAGSVTVTDRLGGEYEYLLRDVVEAVNAVAERQWGGPDLVTLDVFNRRSYLQIMRLLEDAGLVTTYGDTEEPLRRDVSE